MPGRGWLAAALICFVLGPAAAQQGWQQQRMQALNRVADPLAENDPIRNPDFRDDYMHADGSINERVLIMMQKYMPASAGAVPEWAGIMLFVCVAGGMLYGWMQSQQCWQLRENDNTYRLLESRRQRNLHKMDAQGV